MPNEDPRIQEPARDSRRAGAEDAARRPQEARRQDAAAEAVAKVEAVAEALRLRAEADGDALAHLLYETLDDQLRIIAT